MSLLLIDGYDLYSDINDVLRAWQSPVGSPTLSTSVFRSGRASVRATQPGQYLTSTFSADDHATVVVGSGFYLPTSPTATTALLAFKADDGATTHVIIAVKLDGNVGAYRGTTATELGASTSAPFVFGAWNFIEAKVVLHDTTGTVTVKVNGATVLTLTAQDTKNAGTDVEFDTVSVGYISGSGDIEVYWDDTFILNGAGSVNNNFIGECRIRTMNPAGNGNSSQFIGSDGNYTDNYALVDDTTKSVVAYVQASTVDNTDTYAFDSLADATGTVAGVQITTYATKTDTGAKSLAHVTRSDGVNYPGSDIVLPSSYGWQRSVRELDPDGGVAWVLATVNDAEFGVRVRP